MSNILDYIDWRGDLSFADAPFNEVDNLILSEFCYLDLSGIVSGSMRSSPVTLSDAVEKFFREREGQDLSIGLLIPTAIFPLARKMAESRRYKGIRLWGYVNEISISYEQQFSAVCADLDRNTTFVAFRGTDDTIIGWKEDFNMALSPEVPAQMLASFYIDSVARHNRKKLILGGHSKGGNLAVYASVKCHPDTSDRITAVYSNDGPGFTEGFLNLPRYKLMQSRIHSIVPQGSVVGMLLEHTEDHAVVASVNKGVLQHDGFSWKVLGDHFVRVGELSGDSVFTSKTVSSWLAGMDPAERREFVDALFDVLFSTNATTLEELNHDKPGFFKALSQIDPAKRKLINDRLGDLFKEGRNTIGSWINNLFADIRQSIDARQKKNQKPKQ